MRWRMSIALNWLREARRSGDPRDVLVLVSVLASLYRDVAESRRENNNRFQHNPPTVP